MTNDLILDVQYLVLDAILELFCQCKELMEEKWVYKKHSLAGKVHQKWKNEEK